MTRFEGFYVAADDWRSFRDGRLLTEPEPEPPPPDPDPEPGDLVSAFFTDTDVTRWQTRASFGPFKDQHDYATNSPGDWTRIVQERNTFMSNGLTIFDPGSGSSMNQASSAMRNSVRHMSCAALVHIVNGDTAARDYGATELHAQATATNCDFETTTLARAGYHILLNGFSEWLQSMLLAYDLLKLGGATWTTAQENEIKHFFFHAADWMQDHLNEEVNKWFVGGESTRLARGTPRLLGGENGPWWQYGNGTNGHILDAIHRRWENRRTTMQAGICAVMVMLDYRGYSGSAGTSSISQMLHFSRLFVEEHLKWTCWAQTGAPGEQARASTNIGGENATDYAMVATSDVTKIAQWFAKHGDNSLWNYQSSEGIGGTEGTPSGYSGKSLLWLQHSMANYADRTYDRYLVGYAGNNDYRLDLWAPGWDGVLMSSKVFAINHHNVQRFKDILSRHHSGFGNYWPSSPAPTGPYSIYNGQAGIYPGWHFMFAEVN